MEASELNPDHLAALDKQMAGIFEAAEMVFLQAKSEGFADPVVIFRQATIEGDDAAAAAERFRLAEDGTFPLESCHMEREDAARGRDEDYPELATMIRTPKPGYRMTVIYQTDDGITVHDCVSPEDR